MLASVRGVKLEEEQMMSVKSLELLQFSPPSVKFQPLLSVNRFLTSAP